jgi:hypothetical protein
MWHAGQGQPFVLDDRVPCPQRLAPKRLSCALPRFRRLSPASPPGIRHPRLLFAHLIKPSRVVPSQIVLGLEQDAVISRI